MKNYAHENIMQITVELLSNYRSFIIRINSKV